jgi:hypothetical protein
VHIGPQTWSHKRWADRIRAGMPPLAFLSLLASSLLIRCVGTERGPGLISNRTVEAGTVSFGTAGAGGSPSATKSGGFTIQIPTGSGGQFDLGRTYSCAPATAARDCPLPRSTCEGASSFVYYTDPSCVENVCKWTRSTSRCGRGCNDGGCLPPLTAVPVGPIDSGVECTPGDAGACELPPSDCLDQRNLLYFTNAKCVSGSCQAEAVVQDCGYSGCRYGGCSSHLTAAH